MRRPRDEEVLKPRRAVRDVERHPVGPHRRLSGIARRHHARAASDETSRRAQSQPLAETDHREDTGVGRRLPRANGPLAHPPIRGCRRIGRRELVPPNNRPPRGDRSPRGGLGGNRPSLPNKSDGNGLSRSIIARAARFTGCSTRWGTRRRDRLGPIAAKLPRIAHLATAGKHRHQQDDQYPQPLHPADLLSWQVSSFVNSWGSTEIVRHDGAHATRIERARRVFCPSTVPVAQNALPGKTLRATLYCSPVKMIRFLRGPSKPKAQASKALASLACASGFDQFHPRPV